MQFLRDLPIGRKLTIITMTISGVALLIAGMALAFYEQASLRRTMERDFAILTDIFDDNVASGLTFNDPASIEQTLQTLAAHQRIVAAGVYDRQGQLVAQYRHAGARDRFEFPAAGLTGQRFAGDRLDTFKDVVLTGEVIGVVYIGADLSELRERAWVYAGIVGALLLVCSLLALILTARFQRIVSGPIVELAHTVATVAAEKNYAVRAIKRSDDEVGRLIEGFNGMLAQIQGRDVDLQQAHDELELRVTERTRELQQEIAERRRSEAALRESHQRFEIVSRATSDVIWDWHLAPDTVSFNENFQSLFGYSADQVPSTCAQWLVRIHPDDLAGVNDGLETVLKGDGQTWSCEYRFQRHDGSYATLFDRGWVLRDAQGKPWRMIGAMQDISERKKAQEQSAQERERLKFIFESVSVGINLRRVRPDGQETRLINDAHLRIAGLTRKQMDEPDALGRICHPDDHQRQLALHRQLAEGRIDRFSLDKRFLHADGRTTWVTGAIQRRELPDGSYEELSTVVDITDLKRAQEEAAREQARFKFIFESVPVGISLVAAGGDLNTLIVNPAHERITGVSASASNEPGAFSRASHPDDYRRQMELVQPFVRGEIDCYSVEKRYLHADGREMWAVLTSRRFTDATTGMPQVVTTLVDITGRKEAEAKLAYERDQLRSLLEASPDTIYFKDLQSRFVRVSRSKVRKTLEHLPHLRSRPGLNGNATAAAEEDIPMV
jgi:PAS domain S-box-containing protein